MFTRDFPNKSVWLPDILVRERGPLMFDVELEDGRIQRRHMDHLRSRTVTAQRQPDGAPIGVEPLDPDDFPFPIPLPAEDYPEPVNPHEEVPDPPLEGPPANIAPRRSSRTHRPTQRYDPSWKGGM